MIDTCFIMLLVFLMSLVIATAAAVPYGDGVLVLDSENPVRLNIGERW